MAGNRIKFSNRRVADLDVPRDRAAWWYDTDTPGFAITVSPLGKRCFYFVGRIHGQSQRIKVGLFPTVSVDAARKTVRGFAGDVARGKEIEQRRRAGEATIADLFAHYLAVHAKQRKRTWARDERDFDNIIKPAIGSTPVKRLRRDDLKRLLADIADERGKGSAARVHALLSSMFTLAVDDGWVEVHPVRGIPRPGFEPRQRYLREDEVQRFLDAVDQLWSETAADFLRLCLFTGQRRGNVASMRWDELDLSAGLWFIPPDKAKSKRGHVVPLTEHALKIIKRRHGNGSPWVLPADRSRGNHYRDPKHAWSQVRELSGLDDLRLHDLRRSLGAWMQKGGESLQTIGKALGHADVSVTSKFYAPTEHEQIRAASQAAVDALLEAGR